MDGNIVSSIGPGLLCLIGLKGTDTMLDAEFMCGGVAWHRGSVRCVMVTVAVEKSWGRDCGPNPMAVPGNSMFGRHSFVAIR